MDQSHPEHTKRHPSFDRFTSSNSLDIEQENLPMRPASGNHHDHQVHTPINGPNEVEDRLIGDSVGPNELEDGRPNEVKDRLIGDSVGPNEVEDRRPNEVEDCRPNEVEDRLIGDSVDQIDRRDTLSELFEDLEQLVASPRLYSASPAQPSPQPSAYNPSLVTPGAPSLPSARHKIAKLPYHLSTDHHSAIICVTNSSSSRDALTEDPNDMGSIIVPRKRPYQSQPNAEMQSKRPRRSSPIQMHPLERPNSSMVPQKRPRISNDREATDFKRSCTRSDFTSDQGSAATPAHHSLRQPHADLIHHETGQQTAVALGGPAKLYDDRPRGSDYAHVVSRAQSQDSPRLNNRSSVSIPQYTEHPSQELNQPNLQFQQSNPSPFPQDSTLNLPLPPKYAHQTPTPSRSHSRESMRSHIGISPLVQEYAHQTPAQSRTHSRESMRSHVRRSPLVQEYAQTSYNHGDPTHQETAVASGKQAKQQYEASQPHTEIDDPSVTQLAYERGQKHEPPSYSHSPDTLHEDHPGGSDYAHSVSRAQSQDTPGLNNGSTVSIPEYPKHPSQAADQLNLAFQQSNPSPFPQDSTLNLPLPAKYAHQTPNPSHSHSRESTRSHIGRSPLVQGYVQMSSSTFTSPNSPSHLRLPGSHPPRSSSASPLHNPPPTHPQQVFQTHQDQVPFYANYTRAHGSPSPNPTYPDTQISPRSHSRTPSSLRDVPSESPRQYAREIPHASPAQLQELTSRKSQHLPYVDSQDLIRSHNLYTSSSQYTHNINQAPVAQSQEATRSNLPLPVHAQISHNINQAPVAQSQEATRSNLPIPVHAQILTTSQNTHSLFSQDDILKPVDTLNHNPSDLSNPQSAPINTLNRNTSEISNPLHGGYQSSYVQPRMWNGFEFEFGENRVPYIASPAVTPAPPQFFNPRPSDGPSQSDVFHHTQTRPATSTSLYVPRPSSRMSSCSAEVLQNQHPSPCQSGRSSRMSFRSTESQQHSDRSRSRSRQSSKMSFWSQDGQQPNIHPEYTSTYQHPPLVLASRTSTHNQSDTSNKNPIPHHEVCDRLSRSRVHPQESTWSTDGTSPMNHDHFETSSSAVFDPPALFRPDYSQLNDMPTTSTLPHQSIPQTRGGTKGKQPEASVHHRPSLPTRQQAYDDLQNHTRTHRTHIVNHSNEPPRNQPPALNSHVSALRFENDGRSNNLQLPNQPYAQAQLVSRAQNPRPPDVTFHLAPDHTRNLNNQSGEFQIQTQIQNPPQSDQQNQAQYSTLPAPSSRHPPTSASQMQDSPLQPPSWDTFRFDFGANDGFSSVFPSMNPAPSQSSNPPHPELQSQKEPNIFQQTQTQPQPLSTSRPLGTSMMSISSAENLPNQQPRNPRHPEPHSQTEPNIFQRTQPQPQPSTTSLPRRTSMMSICSVENGPNQPPSPSQSVRSRRMTPSARNDPQSNFPSAQSATFTPHQPSAAPIAGPSSSISPATFTPHQPSAPPIAPSSSIPNADTSAPLPPPQRTVTPHDLNPDVAEDDIQAASEDTDESEDDGIFDLAESRKYDNRGASRRARNTTARHDGTRYEKLAKPPVECSQYERLTIALHHYNNLLLGIVRKGKGRKSNRLLPPPPSDDEYSAWDKRKVERRRIVDKSVEKARSRYLRKHPNAPPAQLAKVEDHAAEDAMATIPPVKFTSLVALRNAGVLYSTTVASTCEGALALSGFARFSYDWTDTIKSKWNEAISCIVLQEWEKCYKRGDADDYDIDVDQVTAKNTRQILDRWFTTKSREYSKQCNKATPEENENYAAKQEASKEKNRRRESQKRVCKIRRNTFKTYFPGYRSLHELLSERSLHSEDEVDSAGHSYRKPKLWRHPHLTQLLHELDKLHLKEPQGDQALTSATKALNRGPYASLEDADYLSRPPKGFPKDLLDQQFMNQHASRVAILALALSSHHYDLRPLLARAQWLQLAEGSQ